MLYKISIFFTFIHLFFGQITCQVSLNNPYFWSGIINPNSQYSGRGYSVVHNSTQKTFSQDFQTVLYQKDAFGHAERILINFGDACNVPSVSDVLGYNKNATFSQFIAAQPITALISRGGECNSWFKKVSNLQSFAYYNTQYQLSSVIIYDDNTNFDNSLIQIVTKSQNDPAQPQWANMTLYPTSRNISYMQDNDISNNNTNSNQITLSVYFVPNLFGTYLINTLNDIYSTSSQYLQLSPYFSNKVFTDQDFNGNTSNSPNDNGEEDGGLFSIGHKGNIAYIVAAAAAVILAILLFKWCRRRPASNGDDPENGIGLQSTNRNNNEPIGLTLEQLNTLCPIQTAGDSLIGMKYTTCAICLEDFRPTSTIRILPCHHSYCVDCIDFWLTKKSRFCPVCKNNVDEKEKDKNNKDDEVDLGNSGMNSSNEINNNDNIPIHVTSSLPSTSTISPPPSGINLNPTATSSSSTPPPPSSPPPSSSSPPSSQVKSNDSLPNESQSQPGSEQQPQQQQKQQEQ